MEALAVLMGDLAGTINRRGEFLQRNAKAARLELVDPLLRELGWDAKDPDQVRANQNHTIYALLNDGDTIAAVRIYRLGSLPEDALSRGFPVRARYRVATDGKLWRVLDTADPSRNPEALEFDVSGDAAAECPKAAVLWRRGMSIAKKRRPGKVRAPRPLDGWLVPLTDLTVEQHPTQIVFPDGTTADLGARKSLMVEVARWLLEAGHLSADDCPITLSSKRHLLAQDAVHPTMRGFVSGQRVGGLHLETNFNSRRILSNTDILIEAAGQNAGDFSAVCP